MVVELTQMPANILIHITYYVTPKHRLIYLTRINKLFNKIVYSPLCFQDLWILPVVPKDITKIKTGSIKLEYESGRYCVSVNLAVRNAFVSKIVSHLNRWYVRSNEFMNRSLQNRTKFQDPFCWIKANINALEINIGYDFNDVLINNNKQINIKSLPNSNQISSLLLNGGNQEIDIIFPLNLTSLHLHAFGNNLFSSSIFLTQITNDNKLKNIEYLSVYKCHFDIKQIQLFTTSCPLLSILELFETTWKGIFYLPSSLKSIRWKHTRGKLSFKKCDKNNLIECCIPTLSKSILNCLRSYINITRLVLFNKYTYTLSQDDHYPFSDPWDNHNNLTVVYSKILEINDKNLKTNLKIVFPNALFHSCDVIPRNDYNIFTDTKYIKMLQAFMCYQNHKT